MWLTTAFGTGGPVAGLLSGKLTPAAGSFKLDKYAIAPGVELTGRLSSAGSGFPLLFSGTLAVTGNKAAHGTVTLKRGLLTGTLGGVKVR